MKLCIMIGPTNAKNQFTFIIIIIIIIIIINDIL